MKHQLLKIMVLVFTSISVTAFGQTKTQNTLQNFSSPFAKKPVKEKNVVAKPSNDSPFKITTTKGSFFKNIEKENVSREGIEKRLNAFFNLSDKHSFQLVSENTDKLGFTHLKYQQRFSNIPIEGCIVLVHIKNGTVSTINGKVAEFQSIETNPTISSEKSFANAKDFLKVDGSLLNQYPIETVITQTRNENAEYKLAYKVRIDATKPFMMYNVYIDATTGAEINRISLINDADTAGTATTLYSGTKSITNDSNGGGFRLRESTRPIETYNMNSGTSYGTAVDFTNTTTTWTGVPYLSDFTISTIASSWWYTAFFDISPDLYIILKDGSNNTVYTANYINNTSPTVTFNPNILLQNPPYTVEVWDYDATGGDDFGGSYTINTTAGTQTWSGGGNNGTYTNSTLNNPALDVHWAMEKTYDFYLTQLSRNSFDGVGGLIKNYLNPDDAVGGAGLPNNAFWNGSAMTYGNGDGTLLSPLVGIDVVGHEFTHAVVQHTANLVYQSESGALNESFADIFGTAIEFYGATTPNWTMGENVVLISPFYMRSMSNPNSAPAQFGQQPDTYNGLYWANTSSASDNGGVHINSGVQNFWFYLLCQGGSGTNDISNAYSVTGIGITQAQQIAYRTLSVYLTPNSTYYDSYLYSLQSAEDLYGNPSAQYSAVKDAWYAVGIGNSATAYCSGQTNLTTTSGTFTDGSGSANYLDNANCKWLIAPAGATQITLNFPAFDTEANYDTVFVYDGPDENSPLVMTWWGNTLPAAVVSSGGALFVKFTSDVSTNYTGWSASYTSTGITPTCSSGTVLSTPTGTFNDGSGTGSYGNNQFCYWFIAPPCATAVTLSFSAFATELNYDGIIVYDDLAATNQIGLFTGTTIPSSLTSSTGVMVVVFTSDYATTLQGFSANYTSTGAAFCTGTTTLNTNDAGTFSDGSGASDYCNNQNCSWLVQPPQATSVILSFSAFDVEPTSTDGFTIYDAVEVYDGTNAAAPLLGRFTGNALPPTVTSTGGSIFVKFYSDLAETHQGWTANYTSTTPTYCTGGTSLTAASGTFNDGSGTNNYGNNSNCSWYIHPASAATITLSFSAFATELNYDGVIVYDGSTNAAAVLGTFSGTTIPSSVTSTGGNMYVEFLSDQTTRASGWVANYTSTTATVNAGVSIAQTAGGNPICAGSSVTFTATPTNGGTTPAYQWKVNGGAVGTNSPTFTTNSLTNGQIVTCVMTSNLSGVGGNPATSNAITMTVNAIPPTPTISQSGLVLTSSAATGNQWYFNGSIIPSATSQNYTATQNGSYTVDVTISGCTSSISSQVNIINVGITEATTTNSFIVYPNPNNGKFTIILPTNNDTNCKVKIYNTLGEEVWNYSKADKSNKPITGDLSNQADGIYFAHITLGSQTVIEKIVIERK